MNALTLERQMGRFLHETMELSEQLAEALDRDDKVSVEMILTMRAEPITQLKQADQSLRDLANGVTSPTDRAHLVALLGGEAQGDDQEKVLASQASSNARQLAKVRELDRRLSQKLGRDKSFYR
jgi:hypothetical protein